MRKSRVADFEMVYEELPMDDCTLVKMCREITEKKKRLESSLRYEHSDNYLNLCIARLAYGFAKEQRDSYHDEAMRRGLITE